MDGRPRYAGPVTPDEHPGTGSAEPAGGDATARQQARLDTTLGEAAPTAAVDVPTRMLVAVGTAIWALGLVVTLVVPALHEGDRSWWPWSCVTGIALGAFAWWYVGRTEPRPDAG